MIFIWGTIQSGRGGSVHGGGRNKFETIAWLLLDKTETWEFQEDLPIVVRDRVVPENIETHAL